MKLLINVDKSSKDYASKMNSILFITSFRFYFNTTNVVDSSIMQQCENAADVWKPMFSCENAIVVTRTRSFSKQEILSWSVWTWLAHSPFQILNLDVGVIFSCVAILGY